MFVAEEVIPRLRGLLHAHAAWVAAVAAIVLVVLAPTAAARVAALIYGAGLIALFSVSALYHRWPGDPRWKPWLRRMDHSTIFIFIAASYTPVGLLVLEGTLQIVVLVSVWSGALAGIVMSVAWISAPRWLQALTLPRSWAGSPSSRCRSSRSAAGVAPLVLLAVGGGLYIARRGGLRDAPAEPVAAHVRLPRGLPHARDRGRRRALHGDGRLGRPQRGLRGPVAARRAARRPVVRARPHGGRAERPRAARCLIGMGSGERAGLGERDLADLYYTLLLKDTGCSSNSSRIAARAVADDHRREARPPSGATSRAPPAASATRWPRPRTTGRCGSGSDAAGAGHERGPAPRAHPASAASAARASRRTSASRPRPSRAIRSLDEHWDGNGQPLGLRRRGDPAARAHRRPGADRGDLRAPAHRPQAAAGRWFDPDLVALVREERAPARRDRARGRGRGARARRPPRSRPTRRA